MSLEKKPRPLDFEVQPAISDAIQQALEGAKLSCPHAFQIARRLQVQPLLVGQTADALDVHITSCQLGYFGYAQKQAWRSPDFEPPAIPDAVKVALQAAASEDRITCPQAWAIAAQCHVSRLLVGYAANQLGIRTVQCQLGAF